MAQDQWTLQGKEKESKPMHGPPLQARVAAANRTVQQLSTDDPGAHGLNRWGKAKLNRTGQSKLERGKNDESSGHGMAKASNRHTACRTRPLQADTAGRWSAQHRPQKTTASRWPASQQNNSRRRHWLASRRAVQVCGGSAMVLALRKVGSDLPNLSLPHLSPLPVTVPTHSLNLYKPNLAPNLIFFSVFITFIPNFSLEIRPLTPFNICVRLTYLSLAHSQPLRSLPRGE